MGKLLGGGGGSSTTTETKVTLPGYVENPLKRLIPKAESLANEQYEQYQGQRIQDFTPDELRAFELSRQMVGETPGMMQNANSITQEVGRRGLEGFTQAELDPYMNPYIQNVLDVQRGRAFDTYDRSLRDFRQRAGEAGSFGGSRFALGESEMSDNFQRQLAEQETLGLSNAYQQGLSGAMAGTQLAGQSAMDQVNQANALQGARMNDIGALANTGMQQRQMGQQGLDIAYGDFREEKAFDYEQQNYLANLLLGAGGLTRGETSTKTVEQEDGGWLQKAIGIGSLIAAPFTGGASLGVGAGGIMSSIGGLMGAGTALGSAMGIGNQSVGALDYLNAGARKDIGYAAKGGQGPYRFNDGGKVQRNFNDGGTIKGTDLTGKIGAFMKYLEAADVGRREGTEDAFTIDSNDYEVVEEQPMSPGGMYPSDYRDLWEGIENGQIAPPSSYDRSPSYGGGTNPSRGNSALDRALKFINVAEGGFADVQGDRGGATMHGISSKYFPKEFKTLKTLINNGKQREAEQFKKDFYKTNFYDKVVTPDMTPEQAMVVTDTAVTSGPGTARKLFERSKGQVDKFLDLRDNFVQDIVENDPSQKKFLQGWLNRNENLRKEVMPRMSLSNFNTGGVVQGFSDGGLAGLGSGLLRGTEQGIEAMLTQLAKDTGQSIEQVTKEYLQSSPLGQENFYSNFMSSTLPEHFRNKQPPKDTAFRRDIQEHIGKPASRLQDNLVVGLSNSQRGVSSLLDYFTENEGEVSPRSLMFDKVSESAVLDRAGNRLNRGDTSSSLQDMMNQVGPLSQKGATDVRLNNYGTGLDVYGSSQTEEIPQAQERPNNLDERLGSRNAGKKSMARQEQPPTQAEEKKSGVNYPLVAFGAALLSSDGDFFKALGEGASAAGKTSLTLKEREKEFAQQQIENARAERMAQVQEGNYRINQANLPYKQKVLELEIAQLTKKLLGQNTIKPEDRAELVIKIRDLGVPQKQAEAEVDSMLGISQTQQQQETKLPDPANLRN